ncbi:hypothetical protein HDU88_001698 [Geranomyces variabilis]|nr:hypothetical protein HDU88_001698 [Geranomyces variabilis]
MVHHIQDSSTVTPPAVAAAAAAASSSTSTTPRQLGVLRDGNFPMSLRRSSAPGYSAASFSSFSSSSSSSTSRSTAVGASASASASAASWKRRSDGDAHLQRSFATHTPEASLEFLDHLQSLIIARPSLAGSSSATRRSAPPMIKRPRRSSSASRLSLSALHAANNSSASSASHNNHARSESAQFVDSWLKTLDASAAAAAMGSTTTPRAGSVVPAGEKNTGVLGLLDSRIAELTMEIENLRMKPLLRSAPTPPPTPAPTRPKGTPRQLTDKSASHQAPSPPTAAAVANPFQSLVDHLDTLSLASAPRLAGTPPSSSAPLPPTTPPPHAPPSPTPTAPTTPTPEPARQSAAA